MAVSVDRDFARFGGKSFAINKINTVEIKKRRPHSQNAYLFWGFLGIICLVILAAADVGAGSVFILLSLCVLCGFLAWRAWTRSNIVEYLLFLVTSSQAVQALKSEDESYIVKLRDEIERAMAGKMG